MLLNRAATVHQKKKKKVYLIYLKVSLNLFLLLPAKLFNCSANRKQIVIWIKKHHETSCLYSGMSNEQRDSHVFVVVFSFTMVSQIKKVTVLWNVNNKLK